MQRQRPQGMAAFVTVWFGQVFSLMGTGMTGFALLFWVYGQTGSATSLALLGFFSFTPTVLLSPLAGALVDRLNRKLVMMVSDMGAGAATVALLLLYLTDNLQIWHLYAAGMLAGASMAFQFPAYSAAVTTMLKKEQYARAQGMISLAESGSMVMAPILAGLLLGPLGLGGILVLDLISFSVALGTLLIVHIPQPRVTVEGMAGRGSILREAGYGFRYIWARPSLLGMQLVFFTLNFTVNLVAPVREALVLAWTSNNSAILGTVMSAGAIGGVAGGLLVSAWGGPKRKVPGVLVFMILEGLLGGLVYGLAKDLTLWAAGAFATGFCVTMLNASNQALWQSKVAPDVQGRVFATRRLIAQITIPAGLLIGGPLADRFFAPAMSEGGILVPLFGGIFGVGPASGMSLFFALGGVASAAAAGLAFAFRAVREAETILPDHDAIASAAEAVPQGSA